MLTKRLIPLIFTGAMAIGTGYAADIIVKERPPKVIVESRGRAPGKGYVWIPGYHRWDGAAYVWVKGAWQRPPHAHAKWVEGHWVEHRNGWYWVEGRWK